MAEVLVRSEWTLQELEYAEHAILSNRDLLKQISYERTVGPGVFAEARQTPEVRRGRLHSWEEASEYCQAQNKPLSQLFEAVRIKGSEKKGWWLLK